jgi:predicted Rossmann fold nucleotide-binding protein DprA/Smf involved in DNA uptake
MNRNARALFNHDEVRRIPVDRIISGGQTGVDRAALDAAIELSIPHGGSCPRGRKAEDGAIPEIYQLTELESENYADRTRQNVFDSDGTLILYGDRLEGGTLLTARFAASVGKPCHRVRLAGKPSLRSCLEWISRNEIHVLNIAGPRASKEPASYEKSLKFLRRLFG